MEKAAAILVIQLLLLEPPKSHQNQSKLFQSSLFSTL